VKERVVFEANVPVTAALAYADGLKVQGRFGDQVMYSLTDGRIMYLPPIVRDKLVELGIRQNEPFNICRAERREGNRRFVNWLVQASATARREAEQSPTNLDNAAGALTSRPNMRRMLRQRVAGGQCERATITSERLLQLSVLGFGLLQDGDVGVGVFPEGEEVFVGGLRLGRVTCHRVRTTDLKMSNCSDGFIGHRATMVEDFLKLCGSFVSLVLSQIDIPPNKYGKQALWYTVPIPNR